MTVAAQLTTEAIADRANLVLMKWEITPHAATLKDKHYLYINANQVVQTATIRAAFIRTES